MVWSDNNKLKIGCFVTHFPYKNHLNDENYNMRYARGGVEMVAYQLALSMAQKNHKITVFTTSIDSKDSIERFENIEIYRFGKSFTIGCAGMSFRLLYKPLKLEVDLDIVHAQVGNLPAPLTAYFYAKRRKKPFIVTYHEDSMGGFGSFVRRFCVFLCNHYFNDKLLSFADIILTPSRYYIEESKFLKKYKNKVKAIPNGINLEEFNVPYSKEECRDKLNLPGNKEIILFVGSLTPRKAPHILLKAMKKIVEDVPNAYMIIVGEGMMRKELEEMAMKLKVNQVVRFAGFVKENLKPFYYKSSDVFVLPSFSEGFGIVLLEASACGLPLIVSDLEVFKSIVEEGYNGLSAKTGDEKDLAEKIIYLIENEEIRKKMGENAMKKVKDYSWERIADETIKVYTEVLNEYQ